MSNASTTRISRSNVPRRGHTAGSGGPVALAALCFSCIAIGGAYTSVFFTGALHPLAPWGVAVGSAGALCAMMALGASRRGRLHPFTAAAILVTFVIVAGGFGFALARPAAEGAGGPLWLGLPVRTAVIVYGVGLLPLLVLPLTYALTFDEQILTDDDIERVRQAARAGADRK